MNRHLLLVFCIASSLVFSNAFAQSNGGNQPAANAKQQSTEKKETPQPSKSHLQLAKNSIDFGTIPVGQKKVVELAFTNTGSKPLIITDTYTSCGCTGIEFPQQPFMPGKSGKLTISYDADEEGFFSKTITIYSNADNKKEIIKIQGIVSKND